VISAQRVTMWSMVVVSSKQAHCYIIQFLCAEGVKPADIHSQMKHEYSNDCVQHTAVFDWCKRSKRVGATLRA